MKLKAMALVVLFGAVQTIFAQDYSANVVAYANVAVPAGFSIINNPLNNTNNCFYSSGFFWHLDTKL